MQQQNVRLPLENLCYATLIKTKETVGKVLDCVSFQ